MEVNIFATTKQDISKSMKIYSSKLVEYLKHSSEDRINSLSVKGTNLPIIKNVLSKDIFYPIYAKLKEADINHITDHSYGALAYLLNPERTIVTCHDINTLECPKQTSWLGRKRFMFNLRGMLRAKHIIADSESTKKAILKHFDYNGEIHVIHLGIDKSFNRMKDNKEVSKIEEEYNLTLPHKYILHVGVPHLYKNVESILRVLNKLPDCKLIKVGAFNKKQKRLIKNLKVGRQIIQYEELNQNQLVELYNAVDLLVFPSLCEGFGLPVAEAMACGCPIVCSKTTSLPEVGGEAPFYIDPYSDKELEQAIKRVLDDDTLRKKMIKKGLKQAKKFTWEKTAKQVNDIYRKVAEQSK